MGGGGGSDSGNKTTTSTSNPPDFLVPFLQGGIQDLTNLYHAGGAPDYYPSQTFASMSPQTRQALDMITGRATSGSPVTGAAQGLATDVLGGAYLDPTKNPTFQTALAASHEPQNRQFLDKILPGITSAFEGSGRTGSGLHENMVRDSTMDLMTAQANADAQAGNSFYNAERDRMTGMAGMAPQLANSDYLDAMMLGQAGGTAEDWAQKPIDQSIAQYNYTNNKDWDYINRYLGSLGAGYPGGSTTGTSTSDSSGGGAGDIMGSLGSIASLAMMAFSMFSDERLKENIERVGETDDGLGLYKYNYIGDPRTQIGLIAQEVEQVKPEAVITHPSGFKMVNYDMATQGLF